MRNLLRLTMKSEFEDLELISSEESLVGVSFEPARVLPGKCDEKSQRLSPVLLDEACSQLEEYFGGRRKRFSIPLRTNLSVFQASVLAEVSKIPYGEVMSYKELAVRMGKPGASRAVGSALHKNPIPIFIPCHRVIGSNGGLTGFAGGLGWKRFLLNIESN